jgi:hypothetical protein
MTESGRAVLPIRCRAERKEKVQRTFLAKEPECGQAIFSAVLRGLFVREKD